MSAEKELRSIKGDFIGFTLGDIHSSELGLVRVSDGSRYNQDLLPPLQDKKAQVAGRDGEVYFGSQYGSKPIKVPVAFDNMNEKSFSDLRRLLSIKTPQILWFDETPYKQWVVKSANAQSFKWLCIDESRNGREKRIYKGEGTLEFNCFNSYATSRINYLDEAIDDFDDNNNPVYKNGYENIDEWQDSCRLKNKTDNILEINNTITEVFDYEKFYDDFLIFDHPRKGMFLYNAGDLPIKPKITCKIPFDCEIKNDLILRLYAFNNRPKKNSDIEEFRELGDMIISKDMITWHRNNQDQEKKEDLYIIVDSKIKMIKGAMGNDQKQQLTGLIYNKYHKSGDYLELPVSDDDIYFIEIAEFQKTTSESTQINENPEENTIKILSIEYTHQYY